MGFPALSCVLFQDALFDAVGRKTQLSECAAELCCTILDSGLAISSRSGAAPSDPSTLHDGAPQQEVQFNDERRTQYAILTALLAEVESAQKLLQAHATATQVGSNRTTRRHSLSSTQASQVVDFLTTHHVWNSQPRLFSSWRSVVAALRNKDNWEPGQLLYQYLPDGRRRRPRGSIAHPALHPKQEHPDSTLPAHRPSVSRPARMRAALQARVAAYTQRRKSTAAG